MYESKGQQYVVFMSPAPGSGGGGGGGRGANAQAPLYEGPHGYIAFALPN
jgi:hypothetical protein